MKKNRTAAEFQQKAIEKKLNKWYPRPCVICDIYFGYIFKGEKKERVFFDNYCHCNNRGTIKQSDWQDVADIYNIQDDVVVIEWMDEYWGFEDAN